MQQVSNETERVRQRNQPTSAEIKELEKNFYDKLKLSVNEVQVILIPPGVDLADYLEDCANYNYKHHLLYPVSTENVVHISIDPNYKKLPKLKVNASCPSIRLNFSDNKIIKLFNFVQDFPLPTMPKYAAQPTPVAHINNPVSGAGKGADYFKAEPGKTAKVAKRSNTMRKLSKINSEDEPDNDEWEGPFTSPKNINGNPIINYSQILLVFEINDFAIDIKVFTLHLFNSFFFLFFKIL